MGKCNWVLEREHALLGLEGWGFMLGCDVRIGIFTFLSFLDILLKIGPMKEEASLMCWPQ